NNAGTAEHIHQAAFVRQDGEGLSIFSLTLDLQYLRDNIASRNASGVFSRSFGLRFFVSQESGKTSQIFSRNVTLVDRGEYRTPPAPVAV
ncbi:MAG: hypothetical protein MUF14_07055, partial [Hyphomonadaceae bacterium]|nr:hypothetical protein [Hyphomonadaceae bacterium]